MKTSIAHTLAVGAAALCLAAGAARADQFDTIKANGTLKCGIAQNYVPFSFIEDPKTRQMVGYDVEVCDAIAKEIGVKPEHVFITGATRITDLQQGRTDIALAALTNNPERARIIDFSYNYMGTGVKIAVPVAAGIRSFAELTGKRISGTDGSNLELKLPKVIDKPQLKVFPSTTNAFLALEQGKVDAMAGDETTLLGLIGPSEGKYVLIDQFVTNDQLGIGVRKDEPRVLAAVNRTLAELEKSGKAAELFEKWFGQSSKLKMKRGFTMSPYKPA